MRSFKTVYCRTRFVGFHQWVGAPAQYDYLGFIHRHEFHVEVEVVVEHGDRAEEFHHLKRIVDVIIKDGLGSDQNNPLKQSCEDMAWHIAAELRVRGRGLVARYVDVAEDGECGGRWYAELGEI